MHTLILVSAVHEALESTATLIIRDVVNVGLHERNRRLTMEMFAPPCIYHEATASTERPSQFTAYASPMLQGGGRQVRALEE